MPRLNTSVFDNFVSFDVETIKYPSSQTSSNEPCAWYIYVIGARKYDHAKPTISHSKTWWTQYPLFSLEENNDMLISSFLDWLLSFNENLTIWSHNGGKFDLVFLLNFLKKYSFKYKQPFFTFLIRNQQILRINIFPPQTANNVLSLKLTFLDSVNFFPASLNDLGVFFNLKKLFLNHDLITLNLLTNINSGFFKKKILFYLISDLSILFELIKFYYNLVCKDIKYDPKYFVSLSSLSFSVFKWSYQKKKVLNTSFPEENILKYIRESYTGGRTDIFIPFTDVMGYEYDVNGLYPYVMRNNMYPVGSGTLMEHLPPSSMLVNHAEFGFINITIEILNHFIPPLQIFYEKSVKNINPIGIITGWFFMEEIKNSLENQQIKIIQIHKKILYKKKNIFKEFVDFFYAKRIDATNKLENTFYKNLLNSLYGRFGINSSLTFIENYKITELTYSLDTPQFLLESILFPNAPEWRFKEHLSREYSISFPETDYFKSSIQVVLEFISKFSKEKSSFLTSSFNSLLAKYKNMLLTLDSNPEIASSITSYARIYMQNLMLRILRTNCIYYTDTDSIYIKYPLESSYISALDLGKFKLVTIFKKAYFVAPKVYYLLLLNDFEFIKFKGLDSIIKNSLFTFPFNFWNLCLCSFVEEQYFKLNFNSFKRSKKNINLHFTHTLIHFLPKQNSIHTFNNKTNTKRINIYDKNKIWISTAPLKLLVRFDIA